MQQLALTFEPGLAARYRDLRECFAACVYQRGLGRIAADVDMAPSNLCQALSGERNLDVAVIERYVCATGDTTPILYLAARHLQDAGSVQQQALSQLPGVLAQLKTLMAVAGAPAPKGKR
ncbi:MAG: hypothetical protein KGL35_32440 [Bradyrhizobium sp.]|nr:hypothetical protein [Bradyrhizobium sp.]